MFSYPPMNSSYDSGFFTGCHKDEQNREFLPGFVKVFSFIR